MSTTTQNNEEEYNAVITDKAAEMGVTFVDFSEDAQEEDLETLSLVMAEPAKRLDGYLAATIQDLSRSRLQRLIKEGLVLVNDAPAKASQPLEAGDTILVFLPMDAEIDLEPEDIPLAKIYEDADVVVINKPRGMVVHPAPGNYSGTLVNALLYHCKDLSGINGKIRPGIVHRIDKETTGLLVVAKNDLAHQGLVAQWQARTVERHYTALLHGVMPEPGGRIQAPIARHPKDRKKMAVVPEAGRQAITNYNVLERFSQFTLIDAKLETGRTHQIRVHMHYLNHPVVGDLIYGPKSKNKPKVGQLLHSTTMTFLQPRTGQVIRCQAPLPPDFVAFLEKARK